MLASAAGPPHSLGPRYSAPAASKGPTPLCYQIPALRRRSANVGSARPAPVLVWGRRTTLRSLSATKGPRTVARRVARRGGMLIALALLSAAAVIVVAGSAYADDPAPQDITLADLQLREIVAQGVFASAELFFPGANDWQLAEDGHYLELTFSHSPFLDPDASTMTVAVNGTAVTSLSLNEANTETTTLRIDLPPRLLVPLFNHITFDFLMRIDAACDQSHNPALFARIQEPTLVHYEYAPGDTRPAFQPDLRFFPAPFLRAPFPVTTDTIVITPEDPSADELSAAASIAGRFGQIVGPSAPFLDTLRWHLAMGTLLPSLAADASLIGVGMSGRNPLAAAVDSPAAASPLTGDQGLLYLVPNPFNDRHGALVVSGGSTAGLDLAVRTLASPEAVNTLSGDVAIVSEAPGERTRGLVTERGLRYTLDQLGAEHGFEIRGVDDALHSVMFLAPAAAGDGELQLLLSVSPELSRTHSSLSVILNGHELETIPLRFETELDRVPVSVVLPAESIRAGVNTLTFATGLHPSGHPGSARSGCRDDGDERASLLIHPESTLRVPPADLTGASDLSFYPLPFIDALGSTGDTIVVVPSGAAPEQLLDFAFDLGARSGQEPFDLRVVLGDEVTEAELAAYNVVLLGQLSALPMIEEIGDRLPLPIAAGGDRLLQTDALLRAGADPAAELGILMAAASPWNAERSLLVVSGTSGDSLAWARRALGRLEASGPVTLATAQDETIPFLYPPPVPGALAPLVDGADGGSLGGRSAAVIVAALAAASLGLLGLLATRVRRQEGDRWGND